MANPNLLNITTVTGKQAVGAATASDAVLLANSAASGKLFKVQVVSITNRDPAVAIAAYLSVGPNAAGAGTQYKLCPGTLVPAGARIDVLDKDSFIYLLEDTSLVYKAGTTSLLDFVVTYDELS